MSRPVNPGAAMADVAAEHPRLGLAMAVLTAGVVVWGLTGHRRAWPYLLVLILVTSLAAMAGARGRLSGGTLRALAGLAVAHLIGGLVLAPGGGGLPFYEQWLVDGVVKYDQLVHATGTGILAVAVFELCDPWWMPGTPTWLRRGVAMGGALGLGAVNEVFEFVMAQRVAGLQIGDGANTGWDLVFNLVGATVAALAVFPVLERRRSGRPLDRPTVAGI